MESETLNHLAVVAAALSTFLLGGLWYSPLLFGRIWQRINGFSDEFLKQGNMAKIFGVSFLASLIMAYNLGFFLNDPSIDAVMGLAYGFFTGFGWIAMAIIIIGMFERKSWGYLLIHSGYMTVALSIMGLIIGAWK